MTGVAPATKMALANPLPNKCVLITNDPFFCSLLTGYCFLLAWPVFHFLHQPVEDFLFGFPTIGKLIPYYRRVGFLQKSL